METEHLPPIFALNGWAQPHDGLHDVLPSHAQHIAYSDSADVNALWHRLAGANPSLVVGWSLGGQLAVRAILDGVIRPAALVLIATPWQFVASAGFPAGMGPSTYALFVENYATQPERTARRFAALVAQGDREAARIQAEQATHLATMSDGARWLYWLKLLADYTPDAEAASMLPPTLIIHGQGDGVVSFAQSDAWMRHAPQAELLALDACGHAPHLHDASKVRAAIAAFAARHGVVEMAA